jgi:F0F1-type ATP synthase assembly protein I
MTQSDDDLKKENERLKNELAYERVKRENDVAKAEWKIEAQKSKQSETVAILGVALFCAVVIILGLAGIID